MKFSDALRLADEMELPNLRQNYVERTMENWGGEKPPCCAIGGANVAAGRVTYDWHGDERWDGKNQGFEPIHKLTSTAELTFQQYWGPVLAEDVNCPGEFGEGHCGALYQELSEAIIHLYDSHEWSRTRIADWLDEVAPE